MVIFVSWLVCVGDGEGRAKNKIFITLIMPKDYTPDAFTAFLDGIYSSKLHYEQFPYYHLSVKIESQWWCGFFYPFLYYAKESTIFTKKYEEMKLGIAIMS